MGRQVALVAIALWLVALLSLAGLLGCATTEVATKDCTLRRDSKFRWGEYVVQGCGVTLSGVDRPLSPEFKQLGVEGMAIGGALIGGIVGGPPGAMGGAALGGAAGAVGEVLDGDPSE